MNDKELGKKMAEEAAFHEFARVYEPITGDRLELIARHERPDFVCRRADGSRCGLEFTEVRSDPDEAILRGLSIPPMEAAELMSRAVNEKDRKRQSASWRLPENTILVLQLVQCPLTELESILSDWLDEVLAECGFVEVWIADFTTLEAFREVELYCILPEVLRGYYPHQKRKPYG